MSQPYERRTTGRNPRGGEGSAERGVRRSAAGRPLRGAGGRPEAMRGRDMGTRGAEGRGGEGRGLEARREGPRLIGRGGVPGERPSPGGRGGREGPWRNEGAEGRTGQGAGGAWRERRVEGGGRPAAARPSVGGGGGGRTALPWGGGARGAGPRGAGPRPLGPRASGLRAAGPRATGPRAAGPRAAAAWAAGPRDGGSRGPRLEGPRTRNLAPILPSAGIAGVEREESGAFAAAAPSDLIWGRHSAQAVLESGRPIHRIWCTPEMRFSARFLQLLREAKASGVLVEEVTWARLGQISGGAVHQGIVLQPAAAETLDLTSLIEGCAALGEAPLLLAVDGLTDPQNLGAIVRSAEALGAHGMVLPQRRNAGLTGSVAKVAAGALEHLPIARVVNLNRSLDTLKQEGYRVIGLAGDGTVSLEEADLEGPLVLVTGSEGDGLSLLTRRTCDQLVRIPLRGATPSLNASVATALLLYEVARRGWMRGLAGGAPAPRLVRPALPSPPPLPAVAQESAEASSAPEEGEERPEAGIDDEISSSDPAATVTAPASSPVLDGVAGALEAAAQESLPELSQESLPEQGGAQFRDPSGEERGETAHQPASDNSPQPPVPPFVPPSPLGTPPAAFDTDIRL